MTSKQLLPALLLPVIAWRLYSRLRRTIGRQAWKSRRLTIAVVFFTLITCLIAAGAARSPNSLYALGGGLLVGIPLAVVGLRLTQFEVSSEGIFYTPNTAIGLGVTALLLGRLAYRFMVLFGAPVADQAAPTAFQSPLTLFVFGVTAGYYVFYYAGLLIQGRKKA